MDRFVKALPFCQDDDLSISHKGGVAWQTDMKVSVDYGEDYFNKYIEYEGSEVGKALNACRNAIVNRHYSGAMVDVGIGSGEFVESRPNTWGTDVNPVALDWLRSNGKLAEDYNYGAISFWDVIEHIPDPAAILDQIPVGSYAFFSIPIFHDLSRVRESKHYRPGEHLYYWTRSGFVSWLMQYGFYLLEMNSDETLAGRDSIESFAFVRVFR